MSLHVDPQSLPLNSAEWTDLVEAESRREQAMLSGDVETLATVLADNAVYIHSSAVVDDERTYLIPLRSGDVRYEAIDITVAKVRRLAPGVVLMSGRAVMRTLQYGEPHPLNNLFTMTWVKKYPGGWRMTSWQSTPAALPRPERHVARGRTRSASRQALQNPGSL